MVLFWVVIGILTLVVIIFVLSAVVRRVKKTEWEDQ